MDFLLSDGYNLIIIDLINDFHQISFIFRLVIFSLSACECLQSRTDCVNCQRCEFKLRSNLSYAWYLLIFFYLGIRKYGRMTWRVFIRDEDERKSKFIRTERMLVYYISYIILCCSHMSEWKKLFSSSFFFPCNDDNCRYAKYQYD